MKTPISYLHQSKIVTIRACEAPPPKVGTPEQAHQLWHNHVTMTDWYEAGREQFVLITSDTRHRATNFFLISAGTLNETLVHPREVLRPAILSGAYAIIVAHNHPSGDPTPSEADRSMTRRIRECADLFQIQLLDHLIIGGGYRYTLHSSISEAPEAPAPYFSFKEHGLL